MLGTNRRHFFGYSFGYQGLVRLVAWFAKVQLATRFLIVATIAVAGLMALLGSWLSWSIESGLIRTRSESASQYMEGMLATHLAHVDAAGNMPPGEVGKIDALVMSQDIAAGLKGIRIWDRQGKVLYSTDKSLIGSYNSSHEITAAFGGKVISQLDFEKGAEDLAALDAGYPVLEVFAPIRTRGSQDVQAVGEYFEFAGHFVREIRLSMIQSWSLVGATSGLVMLVLYLMVRRASFLIAEQEEQLQQQIISAHALASQNDHLRREANEARMQASNSNEALLNQIGADLHDGPVQLLSLMILKLQMLANRTKAHDPANQPPDEIDAFEPGRLASNVLEELRQISTGLVMPDIRSGSLQQALELAVERHSQLTGTQVTCNFGNIPLEVSFPLKVCLYRVVQEGLNNAFRHAGGAGQSVSAEVRGQHIIVTVCDSGGQEPVAVFTHVGLGIDGIRTRVHAFGGKLEISSREIGGTQLVVSVPLEQ